MVFFSWIALVAISLGISLFAFLWAMRTGQFSDQGRARYLPLADSPRSSLPKNPARLPAEVYVLLGIAGVALTGILFSIILSLHRLRG
jgi:cbb3-type cytochrome oxidase maturation protein